jgi:hypothetical protein
MSAFSDAEKLRVEVETGIAVTAKTVADLRALPAWPDGLASNIHVDLDPRLSVVKVERATRPRLAISRGNSSSPAMRDRGQRRADGVNPILSIS